MTLTASSVADVTAALLSASARGEKISALDLQAMRQVLEYTPEDMTVSVEAGVTLAQLQARLAEHNQWLPVDPAGAAACNRDGEHVEIAVLPLREGDELAIR